MPGGQDSGDAVDCSLPSCHEPILTTGTWRSLAAGSPRTLCTGGRAGLDGNAGDGASETNGIATLAFAASNGAGPASATTTAVGGNGGSADGGESFGFFW